MDLRQLIEQLRQSTPSNVGVGQLTENEARRLMQGGMEGMSSGMGNLTEAEMAALKFQQMKAQMDQMSRMRQMAQAYGMGPMTQNEGNAMVNAMRQMNPMGNTMQNIPANVGGMSARNTQPPMDINTLLRALGYR